MSGSVKKTMLWPRCNIPANTLPPCDLEWGHENSMHANGGDGFYARDREEEHRHRQKLRDDIETPRTDGPDEAPELSTVADLVVRLGRAETALKSIGVKLSEATTLVRSAR